MANIFANRHFCVFYFLYLKTPTPLSPLLDRKFHIGCFRCNICGTSLAGKEYTIDDQYRVVCSPTNDRNLNLSSDNLSDNNSPYQPNCLEIALGVEKQNPKFNHVSKNGLAPLTRSGSGNSNLNKQNIVKYTWGSQSCS